MPGMIRPVRVGADTGGTFTDLLVLLPGGKLRAVKLATTPADPALGVLDALRQLQAAEGAPDPSGLSDLASLAFTPTELVHGTTVATNALLQRSGGPTALVTTQGFEDLLILGRQARPQIYALHPQVAPPLCPPEACLGVDERLGPDGAVLRPLQQATLVALTEAVRRLGVASVAVVLLHSYASAAHERLVGEALAKLGLPVSLSSTVLPAHREHERAQATVADAYVAPVVQRYLRRLQAALAAPLDRPGPGGSVEAGVPVRLRVMQSNGGAIAADEAIAAPVRTVLSGPAAGVIGAQAVARRSGATRIITLDMGGTSTDVSLVDGAPGVTSEARVAGLPLNLPMLAVHTVGAGGGSLSWVDAGGALHVGPRSAGAEPGPACYGKGGEVATITDADLLLGRLSSARFLGGALRLDEAAAAAAVGRLSQRLGVPLLEAAAGVLKVGGAVVARAVRAISVDMGHDPGEFLLVPFGGAGGVHAADVAEELGIRRILVPPAPGLLCAYGALCAPVVRERARALMTETSMAQQTGLVAAVLRELTAQVHADIEREGGQPQAAKTTWVAELRYRGQSYELALPGAGDGRAALTAETDLVVRFHREHHSRYGFTLGEEQVDLVALRVQASLAVPGVAPGLLLRLQGAAPVGGDPLLQVVQMTSYEEGPLGVQLRTRPAPVLDRTELVAGATVAGPALVVEYSATTVIPPGWRASVDEHGALLLEA